MTLFNVFFSVQDILCFIASHLSFYFCLVLIACASGVFSKKSLPMPVDCSFSKHFLLVIWWSQVKDLDLGSTVSCFCIRLMVRVLFHICAFCRFSFLSKICWIGCSFALDLFQFTCQKLFGCRNMYWFLEILFCSINQHVYFYADARLF